MSTKTIIWIFVFIGSIVGGYIPILWGGSLFSFTALLLSGVGGIIGIAVGIKIGNSVNG